MREKTRRQKEGAREREIRKRKRLGRMGEEEFLVLKKEIEGLEDLKFGLSILVVIIMIMLLLTSKKKKKDQREDLEMRNFGFLYTA